MKSLKTLRDDIYALFTGKLSFSEEEISSFAKLLAGRLTERLSERDRKPSLRLSSVSDPCPRKVWYEINKPASAEPLSSPTRLKFLFGDIIEALVLFLARKAGHNVSNEQMEVSLADVKGHIDATIDGELVDVKSASTNSFKKFRTGLNRLDDLFGYLNQLGNYAHSLGMDRGAFIAFDKQHGHIHIDEHVLNRVDYETIVEDRKAMVLLPDPPPRLADETFQGSGNRKLGTKCSYCSFKTSCWPGLRVFDYAGKPVYLTKVQREPSVPEIT